MLVCINSYGLVYFLTVSQLPEYSDISCFAEFKYLANDLLIYKSNSLSLSLSFNKNCIFILSGFISCFI